MEGAALKDGILEVSEGESVSLHMVASDETGQLKGYVMNGEQPQPGVMVFLRPVQATNERWRYLAFQTDSDGSFDWEHVPAGDYYLFAVDDADFECASLEAVKPYLPQAKAVRVEAHATQMERIPIVSLAKE